MIKRRKLSLDIYLFRLNAPLIIKVILSAANCHNLWLENFRCNKLLLIFLPLQLQLEKANFKSNFRRLVLILKNFLNLPFHCSVCDIANRLFFDGEHILFYPYFKPLFLYTISFFIFVCSYFLLFSSFLFFKKQTSLLSIANQLLVSLLILLFLCICLHLFTNRSLSVALMDFNLLDDYKCVHYVYV